MNNKFIKTFCAVVLAFALIIVGFNVFAAPGDATPLEDNTSSVTTPEKPSDKAEAKAGEEGQVNVVGTVAKENDKHFLTLKITNKYYDKTLENVTLELANNEIGIVLAEGETIPTATIAPTQTQSYKFEVTSADKFLDVKVYYNLLNAEAIDMTEGNALYVLSFTDVTAAKGNTQMDTIKNFLNDTGFKAMFGRVHKGASSFAEFTENYGYLVMLLISFILIYLAIAKGFEPLLLLPIAFGMLLTNLPGAEMFHEAIFAGGHIIWGALYAIGGLLDYLYLGVKLGIYPCLIFLGVGAMTDFGPLIANPKSLLLGAAAQLGIFATFVAARTDFFGFTARQASSIGIIGGADGPTAIFVTTKLAPELLGPIAVAAYSYMALVPVIQPPIMKLLTTKKERQIVMKPLREVSKKEKIIFPIAVTVFVALLVPSAAPLVGCLMLGNLLKESGVTERLSKTAQNELMNIVTIFLGTTVGATATAKTFLSANTLKIIAMGVVAFGLGTAGGVILAKIMNLFTKNKINPLIGSAGVSAVPMAARVSQVVGQKENPKNFLLMHAMGPNVAGVIGSAIAAGVLLALFG